MLCCVCGEDLKDEDLVLRLTSYKYSAQGGPNFLLLRTRFEDGEEEKISHLLCPILAGGPMSLIGATGESSDG